MFPSTAPQQANSNVIAWLNAGMAAQKAGNLDEAASFYQQVLAVQPNHPDALHLRGLIEKDRGNAGKAISYIKRALAVLPESPLFHNSMGACYHQDRNFIKAIECYGRALQSNAMYVDALNNLGAALKESGRWPEALAVFRQVAQIDPTYWHAFNNLAAVFMDIDLPDHALPLLRQGFQLNPNALDIHVNLGIALAILGETNDSMSHLKWALENGANKSKVYATAAINAARRKNQEEFSSYLGMVQSDIGQDEAVTDLATRAMLEFNLATEAIRILEQFSKKKPRLRTYSTLARAYGYTNDNKSMFTVLDRILKIDPNSQTALIMRANDTVSIIESHEQIVAERARVERDITTLMARGLSIVDPVASGGNPHFYFTYQGLDNRALFRKRADFFLGASPALNFVAPHCDDYVYDGSRPLKVGVVSSYFRDHSVGRCYIRLFTALAKETAVEVHAIHLGVEEDWFTDELRAGVAGYHKITGSFESLRDNVAALGLDALIYADIGMDPRSYFLSFCRLAPVQTFLAGHPDTTGVPNMDYFLSSHRWEAAGAQETYTESLVLLDNIPVSFPRPKPPEKFLGVAELGLPENRTLYVCPSLLQKMHPDFDGYLKAILEADDNGLLILFYMTDRPSWHATVDQRLRAALGDELHKRICFVPFLGPEAFASMMHHAHAVLDSSLHFGLGTTAHIGFGVGSVIVTQPTAFLRGRMVASYYQEMGVTDLIANSKEEYVAKAVQVANDPALREDIRQRILANHHVLYENTASAPEIATFLHKACAERSTAAAA